MVWNREMECASRAELEALQLSRLQEKVKQVFSRKAATGPSAGGMGLGLYLAQKIIGASGGSIACQSVLGEGTTLTVLLPTGEKK